MKVGDYKSSEPAEGEKLIIKIKAKSQEGVITVNKLKSKLLSLGALFERRQAIISTGSGCERKACQRRENQAKLIEETSPPNSPLFQRPRRLSKNQVNLIEQTSPPNSPLFRRPQHSCGAQEGFDKVKSSTTLLHEKMGRPLLPSSEEKQRKFVSKIPTRARSF